MEGVYRTASDASVRAVSFENAIWGMAVSLVTCSRTETCLVTYFSVAAVGTGSELLIAEKI